MNNLVLGVDIGGSHITASLVDITNGSVIENSYFRDAVDAHGTAEDIISTWSRVIRQSLNSHPGTDTQIGIAMPGPFDYEHGISLIKEQKKFRSLYGLNVKDLLSKKLAVSEDCINFFNDACCFLGGEVLGGVVKNENEVIGITLGTGLGSAVYKDGSCADAALWNFPFKSGIAEDYLSTRWFTSTYATKYAETITGVKELSLLADEDGEKANIFQTFGANLAEFLAEVSQKTNCNTVVVGGNITKASRFFLSFVKSNSKDLGISLDIRISKLGESATLIGAAGEAHQQMLKRVTFDYLQQDNA